MNAQAFRANPLPDGVSKALEALWHEAQGDWEKAHDVLQDGNADCDWVHAYLHRKEGDETNARYWYRRASKPFPGMSLEEEWEDITKALLE